MLCMFGSHVIFGGKAKAEGMLGNRSAVCVSQETYDDADWRAVVEGLVAKHSAVVIIYDREASPSSVKERLSRVMPARTAFVAQADELSGEYVRKLHQLSRSLDDDPYADCAWGIVTGYIASDALNMVQSPALAIRRGLLKTQGDILEKYVQTGVYHSEHDNDVVWIRETPCGPVAKHDAANPPQGPYDDTESLAEALNTDTYDLMITAGHATPLEWQLHYGEVDGEGWFRSEQGQLYGIDSSQVRHDINSGNPKLYFGRGNCFLGLVDDLGGRRQDCLALGWIHSGGAVQYMGYTSWNSYGLISKIAESYFFPLSDRYTWAEAFYLANQSLLFHEAQATPGVDPVAIESDKDIVVLYGDPGYDCRIQSCRNALYEQSLTWRPTGNPNQYLFTLTARTNEPILALRDPVIARLPFRIMPGNAAVSGGVRDYAIADDTAFMLLWQMGDPQIPAGGEFSLSFTGTRMGTISAAKLQADQSEAECFDAAVTAVFADGFYVESRERASGLKVLAAPNTAVRGDEVWVSGVMETNPDGERCLRAEQVEQTGKCTIVPFAIGSRCLGGTNWSYDANTGAGQRGVKDGYGLNNIGLLVRIHGIVTASGTDPRANATWFYVDDGAGVQDGTGVSGIYCRIDDDAAPPPVGAHISVVGVSGCEFYGGDLVNVLRLRDSTEIVAADSPAPGYSTVRITDISIRPRDIKQAE